mgnify:CR=1 FL=1
MPRQNSCHAIAADGKRIVSGALLHHVRALTHPPPPRAPLSPPPRALSPTQVSGTGIRANGQAVSPFTTAIAYGRAASDLTTKNSRLWVRVSDGGPEQGRLACMRGGDLTHQPCRHIVIVGGQPSVPLGDTSGGGGGDSGGGGSGRGGGCGGGGSGGIAALVLEGAFTSPAEVARSLVPAPFHAVLATPLRWLYVHEQLGLDSMAAAAALSPTLPVFQCHGALDTTVPLRLAEALHRAAREGGARWRPLETVAGGGHDVLEEPQVLRALEVFWRSIGLSQGTYRVAGRPRGIPRNLRFR